MLLIDDSLEFARAVVNLMELHAHSAPDAADGGRGAESDRAIGAAARETLRKSDIAVRATDNTLAEWRRFLQQHRKRNQE